MRYAISGGTGFIGNALVKRLLDSGHRVVVLTRSPEKARGSVDGRAEIAQWMVSGKAADLAKTLEGCDGIINLAGESVGKGRWTARRKQELVESRTKTTQAIVDAISVMPVKPGVFVCASAVGFYGNRGEEIVDESSAPGTGFLAQLCEEWERVARGAEATGVRLVIVRIGLVLGPDGGAFPQMIIPFRFFAGGPIGSGEQWVSWIHLDDMTRLLEFAATNSNVKGILNGTSPDAEKLKEFMRIVGHVMKRPSWLPVPGIILKAALGEQSDLLLGGSRVKPVATEAAGFAFRFPDASHAVRDLLGVPE